MYARGHVTSHVTRHNATYDKTKLDTRAERTDVPAMSDQDSKERCQIQRPLFRLLRDGESLGESELVLD